MEDPAEASAGDPEDLEEDPAAALAKEMADSEAVILEDMKDLKEDLLRCIMPLVLNAEKHAKFHLNQQEISLFIAAIVSGKMRAQERDTAPNQGYLQNNLTRLMKNLIK